MEKLPPPLVPTNIDCTDLDGFYLNVERLMSSELIALSCREAIGAALLLWCRAWKQIPASSLPDDDRVNAAFCGLPLQRFRKLKEEIMRGFVKCSDGRLYHKTLAPLAVSAFARKTEFKAKRERDAKRLREWRAKHGGNDDETRFVQEGIEGEGKGKGISSLSSREEGSSATGEVGAAVREPSDGENLLKFPGRAG